MSSPILKASRDVKTAEHHSRARRGIWCHLTSSEEQTSDSDDASSIRSNRHGDGKRQRDDAAAAAETRVTDNREQLLWHTIGESGPDKAWAEAMKEMEPTATTIPLSKKT